MSRDTLNLDSELLHEIKIWQEMIGRQTQPTFCFELPVYTPGWHMAKAIA